MAKRKDTDKEKRKPPVVARSAIAGRYILKPASKEGKITIREANTAARNVRTKK